MKIIGPIAGIGSRLRPFAFSKPKAFISVAGKTVLEHILDKFSKSGSILRNLTGWFIVYFAEKE